MHTYTGHCPQVCLCCAGRSDPSGEHAGPHHQLLSSLRPQVITSRTGCFLALPGSARASCRPFVSRLSTLSSLSTHIKVRSDSSDISRWVPESERGKFVSFSYLGGTFGSVVTFPLVGYIVKYTSWVWVFYVTAIITFVWFLLWQVFLADFPEDDPFISGKLTFV